MDISTITQIISTVGFPIACCVAMFFQNNKLNENHQEEMSNLKNAIDNNTIAITELITLIKGDIK